MSVQLGFKDFGSDEIFQNLEDLEKKGFQEEEIYLARIFYNAINHEETNKDRHKFSVPTFVNKEDKIKTIDKYRKNPFYLDGVFN